MPPRPAEPAMRDDVAALLGGYRALPGVREALAACAAPRIAVSPLIGGRAVKGPTAKLMNELGLPATPAAIAAHYDGLIDGLVVDTADAGAPLPAGIAQCATATLMRTAEERERLARDVLAFAGRLARARR